MKKNPKSAYEDAKRSMLGSGKRFKGLVEDIKKSGKSEKSAKAIAASVGRKKYGKEKMAKMAAAGRKRKLARKG